MSTMIVNLTETLQKTLTQAGVWVQAVYFVDGKPVWTPLIMNGVLQGNPASVSLPEVFNGGKVYLLVQSSSPATATPQYDATTNQPPDPLQALIQQESDINVGNAASHNIRFDSIEITAGVSASDQGNLTSVVGFGLPMEMKVNYTDGAPSQTVGYNLTGQQLFADIQAIHPDNTGLVFNYTEGPLSGTPRYATAPASAAEVSPSPFSAQDWHAYLTTLMATAGPIGQLAGFYNGSPDAAGIWHNQGFYNYTFEGSADGYFWLKPQANSQIKGYVRISFDDLANSIYATLGSAQVFYDDEGKHLFRFTDPITGTSADSMNVGANNQWGKLFTELLTGLSGGFFGGLQGTSPNAEASTIDLSQSWNWQPQYAFGANTTGKPEGWHIDAYSQIFFNNTNSYGSMYSDNLMDGYLKGGPLVSTGNLQNIEITVFDDSEMPTGYVKPEAFDYLAPTAANGRYDASGTAYSNINLGFNLSLPAGAPGATSWMVDPASTLVTLEFITGYDSQNAPIWQQAVLNASQAGANGSLWWNWSIQHDASTQQFTATPAPNTEQTTGSLVLTGLPVPTDGTAWIRVTVADTQGQHGKTFNLYTTTQGGQFTNDITEQVIDGGALITLPAGGDTLSTYTVNLLAGSATALPPELLIPGGGANPKPLAGTLAVPVVGILETDGSFAAVGGQTSLEGGSVAVPFAPSDHPVIAFGWTGTLASGWDGPTDVHDWLAGFTNKVGALNLVRLAFEKDGKTTTITTQADLDGQWQTGAHYFEAGTYSVSATAFDASDTKFANPLSEASHSLNLEVRQLGAEAPMPARLTFQTGELALDTGAGQHAGVTFRLYQALLDRNPDQAGLGYWVEQLDVGILSADGLAQNLLGSSEFLLHHAPLATGSADLLNLVYQNLLEREADADGLAYWLQQLNQGTQLGDVLEAMANSEEALALYASELTHGLWLA